MKKFFSLKPAFLSEAKKPWATIKAGQAGVSTPLRRLPLHIHKGSQNLGSSATLGYPITSYPSPAKTGLRVTDEIRSGSD